MKKTSKKNSHSHINYELRRRSVIPYLRPALPIYTEQQKRPPNFLIFAATTSGNVEEANKANVTTKSHSTLGIGILRLCLLTCILDCSTYRESAGRCRLRRIGVGSCCVAVIFLSFAQPLTVTKMHQNQELPPPHGETKML